MLARPEQDVLSCIDRFFLQDQGVNETAKRVLDQIGLIDGHLVEFVESYCKRTSEKPICQRPTGENGVLEVLLGVEADKGVRY